MVLVGMMADSKKELGLPAVGPQNSLPSGKRTRRAAVAIIILQVLALVYVIRPYALSWLGDYSSHGHHGILDLSELIKLLNATVDEDKAREWSAYYTAGPHLAGKNISQAEWTRDKWLEFGVHSAEVVSYDVYINYPVDHSLSLSKDGKVKFVASLKEDVLEEDPTTSLPDSVPTFHGYSASGNVTGGLVYVNYGTFWDYEELVKANVSLEGKIAIARYGRNMRGIKVKRAQELGMIGVLMYSDPGDDSNVTIHNGYKAYPDGPARQPSSVQRGSVQFLSFAPGDPTTIGYPSKPGCDRQPANFSIPSIPSIPISYVDALPLLRSLNGHGPHASEISKHWAYHGLEQEGIHYNIGPTPPNIQVNLINEQDYTITPLWNAIGVINGTKSDEVIIIGNHRDAWIAGGAADPNSGSAALNEIVRAFGTALKKGWKPSRTIVFASWDGEEYGLIGSTEWVEEYIPWLKEAAVTYINVDVGASGGSFRASAAPLMHHALTEATKFVLSPNQTVPEQTIHDVWNKHIGVMGSGSDFTAFQDFVGIPCVDVGFVPGENAPVYHYHSNYDSFHWMEKYGDPGFKHHAAIARLIAIMAANLVEKTVVQMRAKDYADNLISSFEKIEEKLVNKTEESMGSFALSSEASKEMKKLRHALHSFKKIAEHFDYKAFELAHHLHSQSPSSSSPTTSFKSWYQTLHLNEKLHRINTKYKYLERQFIYPPGLDDRPWFKHVVFAPGIWTGYSGAVFPGLQERVDDGDVEGIARWAGIIEKSVDKASKSLKGGY